MKRTHTFLLASLAVVLLGAAMLASCPGARAATLRRDRSFGKAGLVRPSLGPAYGQSAFVSVHPQPDGTILAGRVDSGETLERFHRFGPAGQTNVGPVPESSNPKPEAVEPDGEILRTAMSDSLELVDAAGNQDPGFGTQPFGDGRSSDSVGFQIEDIVTAADGHILIAGTRYHNVSSGAPPEPESVPEQVCVARLESSGRLDPSFGKGGVVQLHSELGFAGERLLGIAGRPGGGVVVIAGEALKPGLPAIDSASGSDLLGLTATGAVDPGYGEGGTVHLTAELTEFDSMPDGSLVVAGDQWSASPVVREVHGSDLFLGRFGDDGRPDPGFAGGAGTATVDFGGLDLLGALLVEADGDILLGGSSTPLTTNCAYFSGFCSETPVLARFTAAGLPASALGAGGRLELSALTSPDVGLEGRGVESLAARPGGGVLVGGGSGHFAFLAALAPGVGLDPSFGVGGIATETEPHKSRSGAGQVAITADGHILVAGATDAGLSGGVPEGAVFGLRAGGSLDPTYGAGGVARVPREASEMVASGNSAFVISRTEATVSRLDAAGALDLGFGVEGVAKPGLDVNLRALAALRGGGVLVGGTTNGGKARGEIERLSRDGSRDRVFGSDGVVRLPFGRRHRCGADAIAVQPDGRVLVAGYVQAVVDRKVVEEPAVMRLLADGRVDRSFGKGGLVAVPIGRKGFAGAIAVAPSGGIVVAGRSREGRRTTEFIARLSGRGRLVRSFGKHGVTVAPLPANGDGGEPRQVVLAGDRYLVVRSGPRGPIVAYRPDGRPEPRFAKGVLAPNSRDYGVPAVAVEGGRVLVVRALRKPETFQLQRFNLPARFAS
jgi:uncharacterized delta-60 repeat protein